MFLYRLIRRIPVLKTVVKIVNQFVYDGDWSADEKFAPPMMWIRAIGGPIFLALLISAFTFAGVLSVDVDEVIARIGFIYAGIPEEFKLSCRTPILELTSIEGALATPGSLINSVFPNLLGFGIGVYALVFALAPKILRLVESHIADDIGKGKKAAGSVLVLNASMGYPLIVLVLSLFVATFQQIFSDSIGLAFLTWLLFWYGLIVLVQLIGVLFGLGEHDAIEKISESDDTGI